MLALTTELFFGSPCKNKNWFLKCATKIKNQRVQAIFRKTNT